MSEATSLYDQLRKLSRHNNKNNTFDESRLDNILSTLWKTRQTGLISPHQKSHFQSLLNLSSTSEVDPVLACLRSLIRECVRGNDLLKLFPTDLPPDLQNALVSLFQKHQNEWKNELSGDQHPLPRTVLSYQLNTTIAPIITTFQSSDSLSTLWPQQDNQIHPSNHNEGSTSSLADTGVLLSAQAPCQHAGLPDLENLSHFKSITWTMENVKSSTPTKRTAIICLKLEDKTNSTKGELEVKFRINKDTLEAMLRSITKIKEQFLSMGGSSSGPAQEEQTQQI